MSFARLPFELLLRIFLNFDTVTLCRSTQVCTVWRQCSLDKSLLDVIMRRNIDHCLYFIKRITTQTQEPSGQKEGQIAQRREEFLQETVQLIHGYLRRRVLKPILSEDLNTMLTGMCNLLYQTDKIIKFRVEDNELDLIELALRRQIEQLISMYSSNSLSGSQIIQDVKARLVWEEFVGKNDNCCHISTFMELTAKIFPTSYNLSQLQSQLFFLLNFPEDNMVTVYKWNLLVEQFGPYDQLQEHLESFCITGGFLGMINRVRAEEILQEHPPFEKLVLIRFSRTQPSHLAFSWKEGEKLYHSLNTKRYPLRSFLEKSFKGFSLVPVRIKPAQGTSFVHIINNNNSNNLKISASGYVSSEMPDNSRYLKLEFENVAPKKRKITGEHL
eukprot:TRINITY_DN15189_c0_g1_i1.p1 TRINITY_DN15189_c0_g1~~TRINITY_DN15189_c0_g1_i1.p1  ORF type:complete len:386 (-),score=65.31 TRINITY_DN15189_c0_g1_i1:116-1273(-)